eukprot:1361735-Prymnesium_polylepis.1
MNKLISKLQRALQPMLKPLRPLISPAINALPNKRVQKAISINDLRAAARGRAHHMVFEYIDGGADNEVTLRRNRAAFEDIELHYRVLAGNEHADIDTSATVLGQQVSLPFFGAPTAGNCMFHAEGEVGVAGAAAQHGAAYALSTFSTSSFDKITAAYPGPAKTFQLYVWRDRDFLRDILVKARAAGFTSLALTCDMAWFGNREREVRAGFSLPPSYSARQVMDAMLAPAWSWDFVTHPAY